MFGHCYHLDDPHESAFLRRIVGGTQPSQGETLLKLSMGQNRVPPRLAPNGQGLAAETWD